MHSILIAKWGVLTLKASIKILMNKSFYEANQRIAVYFLFASYSLS